MGWPAVVFELEGQQHSKALGMEPSQWALLWNPAGSAHVAENRQIHDTGYCLTRSWECIQVRGAERKLSDAMIPLAKQVSSMLCQDGHGAERGGAPRRNTVALAAFAVLCCQILTEVRWVVRTAGASRADQTWVGYMDWQAATTYPQVLLVYVLKAAAGSRAVEAVPNESMVIC